MRCYWYIINYLFISFVLLFRSYFILLRGIETRLSIYCSLSIPELWISAYEQVPSKLATLRAGPISSPSRCAESNCEEKSGVNEPKHATTLSNIHVKVSLFHLRTKCAIWGKSNSISCWDIFTAIVVGECEPWPARPFVCLSHKELISNVRALCWWTSVS